MSTDLPPQAYTRETLQEAFNWLQNQPEAVRASVHTPERLVSLFHNSQRLNDIEAPVSSKKFVTDLKNLASSLDQFRQDDSSSLNEPFQTLDPVMEKVPQVKPSANSPSGPKSATTPPTAPAATTTVRSGDLSIPIDDLTQRRLSQARERLNLSSDAEALRLLISLGFEKFSQLK